MNSRLTLYNCTFNMNFALQDGGAIFNDGGELKVINSTFTHNQADGASFLNDCDGGATKAHLFVDGCVFEFNTAGDSGGAIYATGGLTLGNNPSNFYSNVHMQKAVQYVQTNSRRILNMHRLYITGRAMTMSNLMAAVRYTLKMKTGLPFHNVSLE